MTKKIKNFWDASIVLSEAAANYHDKTNMVFPYENNILDLTIMVSCFNEEDYISDTLNVITEAMKVIKKTYEIIVIDDCSQDNSTRIITDYIQQHPNENIILRINTFNKGLAQNFVDGAFIGRGKYYRLICGDNAEPKETIVRILSKMGEADIIIPYYVNIIGKSLYRRVISKVFTWIINTVSGNKLYYYNGLQLHLRHNVMRWHPNTRGFGFQADMLCALLKVGCTYIQVPCSTIERRGGHGNALTWKNFMAVNRTIFSILLRRMAPWT